MKEMWSIKIHPKAKKELLELSPNTRKRIASVIQQLERFPNVSLDIKLLKGISYGKYRFLRVKKEDYRVVLVPPWSERTLLVVAISHRRSVYRKIKKLI